MRRWWAILAVTAFMGAGAAQAQPREVRSVEGVTEFALPNGLAVLLHEDPSKPTTTVAITYRVGSRHEGPGETGAAHMLFRPLAASGNAPQEMARRGVRFNGTSWERTADGALRTGSARRPRAGGRLHFAVPRG